MCHVLFMFSLGAFLSLSSAFYRFATTSGFNTFIDGNITLSVMVILYLSEETFKVDISCIIVANTLLLDTYTKLFLVL